MPSMLVIMSQHEHVGTQTQGHEHRHGWYSQRGDECDLHEAYDAMFARRALAGGMGGVVPEEVDERGRGIRNPMPSMICSQWPDPH